MALIQLSLKTLLYLSISTFENPFEFIIYPWRVSIESSLKDFIMRHTFICFKKVDFPESPQPVTKLALRHFWFPCVISIPNKRSLILLFSIFLSRFIICSISFERWISSGEDLWSVIQQDILMNCHVEWKSDKGYQTGE